MFVVHNNLNVSKFRIIYVCVVDVGNFVERYIVYNLLCYIDTKFLTVNVHRACRARFSRGYYRNPRVG